MKNRPQLFLLLITLCVTASLSAQDAATSLKPLNKRGVVRLKTIADDFAANEVAAIAKYSGRRITVLGRISKLSQGNSENKVLVVTLQDAAAARPPVKAEFLAGSFPQNTEIQVSQDGSAATMVRHGVHGEILSQNPFLYADQLVAIKGDYKKLEVGSIVLTDCKIIPKERLHELRHDLEKNQS